MINTNRLKVDEEIKNNKLEKDKSEFYEVDNILFTKFQNNRQMTVISNVKNNKVVLGKT